MLLSERANLVHTPVPDLRTQTESYLSLIELDEGEPGMIDHPIFFCPFCGTKLQDPEVVQAQITSEGELQQ